MSVYLVNIHFNVASIKKVFSSSTFQRCLLLRTSPAGMGTGKGLFSGKWDLWHGNGQRLRASALFEVMGRQERFLPVVHVCWPFNLTHPLCSQQLSLASSLLCGIMEQEGKWHLWSFEVDSCTCPDRSWFWASAQWLAVVECRQPYGWTGIVEVGNSHAGIEQVWERRWHKIQDNRMED